MAVGASIVVYTDGKEDLHDSLLSIALESWTPDNARRPRGRGLSQSDDNDCDAESTWMKGLSTRLSRTPASVSSGSRLAYSRTGVLAKSVKRRADGDNSIVEAPIAVYTDSDALVLMATL